MFSASWCIYHDIPFISNLDSNQLDGTVPSTLAKIASLRVMCVNLFFQTNSMYFFTVKSMRTLSPAHYLLNSDAFRTLRFCECELNFPNISTFNGTCYTNSVYRLRQIYHTRIQGTIPPSLGNAKQLGTMYVYESFLQLTSATLKLYGVL